jgi:hypothetical protein
LDYFGLRGVGIEGSEDNIHEKVYDEDEPWFAKNYKKVVKLY